MPFEVIKQSPWNDGSFNEWTPHVTTMLSPEELRMLRWLTSTYYSGVGAIIDGGCFVGGSTIALAQGLRDAHRKDKIDSYDLFIADGDGAAQLEKRGFVAGSSVRSVFDENVAAYADLLTVHHGDIILDPWNGNPIELLFVDVAKVVAINDMIVSKMFPCLIPNRSVVIQQDYLYYWLPWIHITMEKLSDHFLYLADTGVNSVVFGLSKAISIEDAEQAQWVNISPAERVELMDRAIARWTGPKRDYLVWAKRAYDLSEKMDCRFIPGNEFPYREGSRMRRIIRKAKALLYK